jgi:NDP-sugar pyrophosphorylase family protein
MTPVKPSLVIMAAGLGSRFGGVKQLARVGPNNEAILDFAIKDGLDAGFDEIILIVRHEILDDVKEQIAAQHPDLKIVYVCQDDLGPARSKPWGTLHAVLSAADVVTKPFAVINADDYYGPETFRLAAAELESSEPGKSSLVAFEMANIVPPEGAVTRAVCAVEDGHLAAIVETDGCERRADGTYNAGGETVPGDTPVSMNFWAFHHSVIPDFQNAWELFYAENADAPKAEALLPTVVGDLVNAGRLKVHVVQSPEQWYGITNPDDFERVKAALAHR